MKTVRDAVEPGERVEFDGRTVMVLADDDPILDYPVIEPSGVVLAVDREKLEGVVSCWYRERIECAFDDAPGEAPTPMNLVARILTSMAEQGFREVEEVLYEPEPDGPALVTVKPLPPAKED